MSAAKQLTWEHLTVGERLASYLYEVGEEAVAGLRQVIGDDDADRVPAAILNLAMLNAIDANYGQRGGTVHARQRFAMHGPLRVGDRLTVDGQLLRMELKRQRRYLVIACDVHDQDGRLIATGETTVLYPGGAP